MNRMRSAIIGAAVAGSALVGGAVGSTLWGSASAQTDSSSTTAPAQSPNGQSQAGQSGQPPRGMHDPSQGGHVGANGVKEELLTGETAQKVRDAASAAVPGGTIERVENDAEGSPYEAHVVKSDGSHVTVKVDADFKVTSVEDGPR